MSTRFISKVTINEKPAYLQVARNRSGISLFNIKIFLEDRTWTGNFTYEDADKFKERLQETKEEYYNSVEDILKKADPMYRLELKTSDGTCHGTFSWKKKYEGSTAVLLHGSMGVQLDTVTVSKDTLIDILLEHNETLLYNVEICKETNKEVHCELEKYKIELEKLIEMKRSLEDTLYGRFAQLLNSKKKRIQYLEDALSKRDEK